MLKRPCAPPCQYFALLSIEVSGFKGISKQISLERNSEGSSLLDFENRDKVMTPSIVTDVDGDWWMVGEQAREPRVSLLVNPNPLH